MTTPQLFAFAILAAMMALFVWGRLRYDMVAVLALLAGVVAGIVPTDKAFSGFSDDIVIIVASALVVSAAVARSGVIEKALRPIAPFLTTPTIQVFVLTAVVAALSGFVKNIGALAMMMPVAFQLARRTGTPPSAMLMPMAFGSLLGGIVTLVGTSPNIIVSRVRQEIVGQPFSMFDFTPVGVDSGDRRRCLSCLRMAAAAGAQGRSLDGRCLQPGRLHHRGFASRRNPNSPARR